MAFPLSAQETVFSEDSLSTRYTRGLNEDEWEGFAGYQWESPTGLRLSVFESFSSSRLLVNRNESKWKDENRLILNASQPLLPSLSLDFFGSSRYFSDKHTGFVNDIQTQTLGLGATIRQSFGSFPFHVGIKDDKRYEQHDTGWTSMVGASMPRFRFGEYQNSFEARYEQDQLDKRKNDDLRLAYDVSRQFYNGTHDSLRLTWQKGRRDYYISRTGEIESRDEQRQTVRNTLVYRISDNFRYRIVGGFSTRQLNINVLTGENKGPKRQRRDFELTGNFGLLWKTRHHSGNLSFRYNGQEENYELAGSNTASSYSGNSQLLTPDNKKVFTALFLRNIWSISNADTIDFVTSLQRKRHDTPDENNNDDRDELRYRMTMQHLHYFSDVLSTRLELSAHLLHFVYISGEKSADNSWNRIFRFKPEIRLQPSPKVRFSQSAQVLANYVAYDFETQLPGIRSFVYRKYQLEDSLQFQVTEQTGILFQYKMELDENGKLLWTDWLEQKLTDRQSHTVTLSLIFEPIPGFAILPGYAYFHRRGYRYQLNPLGEQIREHHEEFQSHGPAFRLHYFGDRLNVILSGSTIVTKTQSTAEQLLTRVDCRMSWRL